jgi:hypothetical protein
MALQDKSILTLFSLGYVTVNKERTSRKIQCLPVESATATDGEVTHNPVEEILKGTDKDGNAYEVKATQTRDLECEWMPTEDNRATPPDMRRGEMVEIYRVGKTSQYYWRCMGFRNGLRNLEHVVYLFAASPDAGGAGGTFEKCYSLVFSPWDGYIQIKTTKANGEPFAYVFEINTKQGWSGLSDDVGNYWEVNSKDSRVKLQNVNKSMVSLEKQEIDIKADKRVTFTVGGTVMELTPESISEKTTTINIEATTYNLKAQAVKATVGRWDWL